MPSSMICCGLIGARMDNAPTTMTDEERESAIARSYMLLIGSRTAAGRRKAWKEMQGLVLGRSEAKQTQMALQQGLPPVTPRIHGGD